MEQWMGYGDTYVPQAQNGSQYVNPLGDRRFNMLPDYAGTTVPQSYGTPNIPGNQTQGGGFQLDQGFNFNPTNISQFGGTDYGKIFGGAITGPVGSYYPQGLGSGLNDGQRSSFLNSTGKMADPVNGFNYNQILNSIRGNYQGGLDAGNQQEFNSWAGGNGMNSFQSYQQFQNLFNNLNAWNTENPNATMDANRSYGASNVASNPILNNSYNFGAANNYLTGIYDNAMKGYGSQGAFGVPTDPNNSPNVVMGR